MNSEVIKLVFGLIIISAINKASGKCVHQEKTPVKNVAVIGAGTSGLISAKYSIAQGFNVTIYEQSDELGGIWYYTDEIGKDQYGVDIHTAMYKGLRTNLPHQVMEFSDHYYPNGTIPYPPQADVLNFLHSYADRFDLKKHIKFNYMVIRILPIENDKWEIIVKDLRNDKYLTNIYDAVFVANGHFSSPRIANIDGVSEFKGKTIHSHDFRKAEDYIGEKVLVIGAGPSGMDLVAHLSRTAERVTFSQHKRPNETKEERDKRQSLLPPKATLQDNVIRFTETGAEFIDGSHQTFTVVFFATGYNFKYPFLSVDTAINVDNNCVMPLYKQIFNIEYPTMAFIGIPFTTSTTKTYDLQVRFAVKFLSGEKKLPSKAEMLSDMHTQLENHWKKGYRKHYSHYLGPEQKEYFKQLSEVAEIENIPDVIAAMHADSRATMTQNPAGFRKYKYTIIDGQAFVKEKYEN